MTIATGECPACSSELIGVLGHVTSSMSSKPPPNINADVPFGWAGMWLCWCAECGNLFAYDQDFLLDPDLGTELEA